MTTTITLGGIWTAQAATGDDPAPNEQPALVEDFSYPGAASIEANYHVNVISGDGHILFADCSAPPENNIGALQVRAQGSVGMQLDGRICFKILATPGTIEVKIPKVYEIRGDGQIDGTGHKVKADLTTDSGTHTTVDVNPNRSTPVGTGSGPQNPETTLLRLTASS
ncbi:hypothetical protein [Amycolatopsis sp. Poz14]|uniref:hypothetical protein n=1 Tax=Amycolatopsis sp. Poz14 TaxID=1447705 RepID=UPI001EE9865C|nr:hypothetical protein [Amycolatopsis sp. Poz14]MCG3750252.1 hypothetical protein [Amycolatopsis sp. Poz14]